MDELQTGYWCEGCEFFEGGEMELLQGGYCAACGCSKDNHTAAKVVAA